MTRIAPSIIACDFTRLREEIKRVEDAGCDLIHLDVMDGHFVPNITFGPLIVNALSRITNLPLDVHLMITNPEKYWERFEEAGADFISFHIEIAKNPREIILNMHKKNIKAGVALNPGTPVNKIKKFFDIVDFVLVMTVNPGFSGQDFIQEPVEKIRELKKYNITVEVDGGINENTAPLVIKAGADILVSGTGIFKSKDVKRTIEKMKSL
jgi:ribulose-phosphate 3-epimerase